MRTKDRTIFLERAIKDVLAQSYKNWFLCIVNDGGKVSEVDKLVKKYKSHAKQIKVIHHAKSKGMEAASNAGIKATNGELIVIHDDDDFLDRTFLQKAISYLQYFSHLESIRGVAVETEKVLESIKNNNIVEDRRDIMTNYDTNYRVISLSKLTRYNQIAVIGFIYKRSALRSIGMYNENFVVAGDYDFNIRFCLKYDVVILHEALAFYSFRKKVGNLSYENSVSDYKRMELYKQLLSNKNLRQSNLSSAIIIGNNASKADLTIFIKFNNILKTLIKKIFRI